MTSAKQRREFSQSPSPDAHSPQPVSPSANGTTTRAKSGNSGVDHHLRIEPHIKSSGGITGLGLEQFSDNDRFAAVVKYLANPTVFHQVSTVRNFNYNIIYTNSVPSGSRWFTGSLRIVSWANFMVRRDAILELQQLCSSLRSEGTLPTRPTLETIFPSR